MDSLERFKEIILDVFSKDDKDEEKDKKYEEGFLGYEKFRLMENDIKLEELEEK
jgi:hypothetical protein